MENSLQIDFFIDHAREGSFFTIPFTVPAGMESFRLTYHYETHTLTQSSSGHGIFTSRSRANIIDLGLLAPDGSQVGASGSDKSEIEISPTQSTPGYSPHALTPGEWQIIVGAYHVVPAGVTVHYEITFIPARVRLFKGDLHMHTLASDGVLTVDELARHALRHGLDFLAVTDHNQFVSSASLPRIPGLTLIPGIEWTHYQGHANFLGSDQPYQGSFLANTPAEAQQKFSAARASGAVIVVNHPMDEYCPFKFDLQQLPFDCIEVWNGPMHESNLRALGLWHSLLASGKKIPICGGSDYHRDNLFLFVGGPTTCLFSPTSSPSDLLAALKQGHAYITFAPNGPVLEMSAGSALPGDSVPFDSIRELNLSVEGLQAGDVLQVTTAMGSQPLLKAETAGSFVGQYKLDAPGFAHVEILRAFIPGIPLLPALISNPIYFDA